MDQVYWFVRKDTLEDVDEETQASFDELAADEVTVCDYGEAILALATYAHNDVDRVFVDPGTLNLQVRDALDENGYDVVEGLSPVPLRKSVKNRVEIEGMRELVSPEGQHDGLDEGILGGEDLLRGRPAPEGLAVPRAGISLE